MTKRQTAGFTLIELIIVVAVIAILAAIAYPSFNGQIRKARRSDAMTVLQDAQLHLEKWRVDNPSYAGSGITFPSSTYYTFALAAPTGTCADGTTATSNKNSYQLTADTAGSQVSDDSQCATLVVTSRCGVITRTSTPAGGTCW